MPPRHGRVDESSSVAEEGFELSAAPIGFDDEHVRPDVTSVRSDVARTPSDDAHVRPDTNQCLLVRL